MAGISFTLVYIEHPRGFNLGLHALISSVLHRNFLAVVVGKPSDCKGIVDGMGDQHQVCGFRRMKRWVYNINRSMVQFTMVYPEVNPLSKHPVDVASPNPRRLATTTICRLDNL